MQPGCNVHILKWLNNSYVKQKVGLKTGRADLLLVVYTLRVYLLRGEAMLVRRIGITYVLAIVPVYDQKNLYGIFDRILYFVDNIDNYDDILLLEEPF